MRFSIPVPYIYTVWVPGYKLWGTIPIPGHQEPRIGIRWVTKSFRISIPHYVPPKIGIYYTYLRVPDLIPRLSPSKTVIVKAAVTGTEYVNIIMVSKAVGSVAKVYTGSEAIKLGVTIAGFAPPFGAIAGGAGVIVGSIQVSRGFAQFYDATFQTPWTTSRSYEEQLNEDWNQWIRNAGPW